MITSNDKVGNTEVFADDGVPNGFSRTGHAHSERKEGEVAHSIRVFGHNGFVYTDTGIVVDITGLGETDDGVDEDISLTLASGADGEFSVGTMHGITGLETDYFSPGDLLEVRSEFCGCI